MYQYEIVCILGIVGDPRQGINYNYNFPGLRTVIPLDPTRVPSDQLPWLR